MSKSKIQHPCSTDIVTKKSQLKNVLANAMLFRFFPVCLLFLTLTNVVAGKKPHILMVIMDDLGSHDLGLHGSGIHTPNTDRLAQEGIYLDNYYVLPYCSPTRASLMSSMYPIHHGVATPIPETSTAGLPLNLETLPDLLKRGGYQTHAVGKWHLGYSKWEYTPTFRGFDSFFGFYTGGQDYFQHSTLYRPQTYDMRLDKHPYCGAACSQIVDERGNYSTHLFTRKAIQVITDYAAAEKENDQPLFLYLAFQAVHAPDEVPQEYRNQYADKNWTEIRKTYAGMLSAADEGIGNVTTALMEAGLWDETLIIFSTDNGGPTVSCAVQGSSNYPKRGGKCSVWEGGTRGDGFLSGPMLSKLGLPVNIRFPHLFHVVDWMPTIAELINTVPRNFLDLDGKSQVQHLKRGDAGRIEAHLGYSYSHLTSQWYGPAIKYGDWKLVQGTSAGPDQFNSTPEGSDQQLPGGMKDSSYLLFDLSVDEGEEFDLSEQYPDMVKKLRYILKEYHQSYVPPQPDSDPSCPFTGFVNTSVGPTW